MDVVSKKQIKNIFKNEKVTGKRQRRFRIEPQIWFLFICFILLHVVYEQAVIPPQHGWWNYYAWRIAKGDILYKDIFFYMPPYYLYFMAFLYKIFGSFVMGYNIVGLLFRWIEVVTIYSLIRSFTSKNVSFLCTFAGLVLQISYLMDFPFDYNQIIRFYVTMSGLFCIKGLTQQKETRGNIYLAISGVWLGIGLFSKQTCIVIIFFALLGIMIFYLQRNKVVYAIKKIAVFVFGIIIAILPGIIALFIQGSFRDFIYCMTCSMTVKGDFGGFFGRVMRYQFHFLEVVIAVLLFALLLFQDRYNKGYRAKIIHTSTGILVRETYHFLLFLLILYRSCQIIQAETGSLTSYTPILNGILIYLAVRMTLICLCNAANKVKQKKFLEYSRDLAPIAIGASLACSIIITYCMDYQWRANLYNQMSLFSLKRGLINVIFWVMLMVLIYQLIQFILKREIYGGGVKVLVFNAFTISLVCLNMVSSIVEELFIASTAALFFAMLLNAIFTCPKIDNSYSIKNTLSRAVVGLPVLGLIVICIFITVTEKQVFAYTWHRWDSVGLGRNDVNYVYSAVNGLEGYKLDFETEKAYETIVNLIEKYTNEEDIVYQFPNIPLFNVLTERKIGTYAPIHYFDVCPD